MFPVDLDTVFLLTWREIVSILRSFYPQKYT